MRNRQFQGLEQLEARRLLAVSIDNLPATNIALDFATVGVEVLEYGRSPKRRLSRNFFSSFSGTV